MTTLSAILLAVGVFGGMLLCLEIGLWIGLCRHADKTHRDGAGPGFVALGGALFALLGLLIAFSFSGAASRFEVKRHLIVDEANVIETAYMRVALLPAAARPALREEFGRYLDARLAVYQRLRDMQAENREISRAGVLQREIWELAVAACEQTAAPGVTQLVISSLNDMFSLSTNRAAALRTHAPATIFGLLAVVSFVCSFMAGFDASCRKTRSLVHSVAFAAVLAIAFYVILDLEYPRVGLIQLTADDQALIEVRKNMK